MKEVKVTDEQNAQKWLELIRKFNELVKEAPAVSKIKAELEVIKLEASTSILLNIRQREAIIARVNNYLAGTYGNTKTDEQMAQSKSGK